LVAIGTLQDFLKIIFAYFCQMFVIPFKNYGWWPEPPLLKKENLTNFNKKKLWKGPNAFRLQENDTLEAIAGCFNWIFLLILPPCSTFSNDSHVRWSAGTSETIFKLDTLRLIVVKFGSNWFSGFREEDFLKSLQVTKSRTWGQYQQKNSIKTSCNCFQTLLKWYICDPL
jgi:hypothetical protein